MADTNSLSGAYSIKSALAKKGIQPVTAVQASVSHPALAPGAREISELTLIAQSEAGYLSLVGLLSQAMTGDEAIALESLLDPASNAGILVLTGGHRGPVDRALAADAPDRARQRLTSLSKRLGDRLYVEIQRQDGPTAWQPALIELARGLDLPLVATHETWFLDQDFVEAHDALLCISQGLTLAHDERRHADPSGYLLPPGEMAALFADIPDALTNTIEIARRCDFLVAERTPMSPLTSPENVVSFQIAVLLVLLGGAWPMIASLGCRLNGAAPGLFLRIPLLILTTLGAGVIVTPAAPEAPFLLLAFVTTLATPVALLYRGHIGLLWLPLARAGSLGGRHHLHRDLDGLSLPRDCSRRFFPQDRSWRWGATCRPSSSSMR